MRNGVRALLAVVLAGVFLPWAEGRSSAATPPDPFLSAPLYVDPAADATVDAAKAPAADAPYLRAVGHQSTVIWYAGKSAAEVQRDVTSRMAKVRAAGALPTIAVYDIPDRDCGGYSAGGAANAADYEAWIRGVAAGLGNGPAAVIVEPDALVHIATCNLSSAEEQERLGLLKFAVETFAAKPGVGVYLEAGTTHWHPASLVAQALRWAGVDEARGFALNVAGFDTLADTLSFGTAVSKALGGSHFIVDTGRNGTGPWNAPESQQPWCNPPGRALGHAPTETTGNPLVDAYLWVKQPGASDGKCRGGTVASGVYDRKLLLDLAKRAYQLGTSDIFTGYVSKPAPVPAPLPVVPGAGSAVTRMPAMTVRASWKYRGRVRLAPAGVVALGSGGTTSTVRALTAVNATWTVRLGTQPSLLDLHYGWLTVRLQRDRGFVVVTEAVRGKRVAIGRQRLAPGARFLLTLSVAGGRARVSVQRHGVGPVVTVPGYGGVIFTAGGGGSALSGAGAWAVR